ncbi:uncharacterized protein TRIVIDRAFT_30927 [Trichoderma virens Gv29-8]|uniref:Uncharacterized protein n=1 Tax=Hypocrea virens (strain Gv29-8 / FGSC 10586) TaxID=413071 RepID=G9MLZ1_HYPVG|nr:uncharacterized protein TRIVIDRAFT_30927 [Trichoderma virens Gv29-8]EHK24364.1 hypothetical protein TRIVIDRAFT_30927 [Trichoderma virens Gv29-8]
MDKCWFVLRQTHYPAPKYTDRNMAYGEAKGPLRLGHLIPGPKAVDEVINSDAITPFPSNMHIFSTTTVNFWLSNKTEKETEAAAQGEIPIAAAAGVTVKVEAGVVFRKMMGDTWAIDRLETQIVQPTLTYLDACRKSAQVAAWIDKNKTFGSWKVYMISGLMIARGAKSERTKTSTSGAHGGAGGVGFTANIAIETSGQHADDFVWAIRLTEVSKGPFHSDLSRKPVMRGAVFAPGVNKVDVNAVFAEEGLDGDDVHVTEMFDGDKQQFLVTMDGY